MVCPRVLSKSHSASEGRVGKGRREQRAVRGKRSQSGEWRFLRYVGSNSKIFELRFSTITTFFCIATRRCDVGYLGLYVEFMETLSRIDALSAYASLGTLTISSAPLIALFFSSLALESLIFLELLSICSKLSYGNATGKARRAVEECLLHSGQLCEPKPLGFSVI